MRSGFTRRSDESSGVREVIEDNTHAIEQLVGLQVGEFANQAFRAVRSLQFERRTGILIERELCNLCQDARGLRSHYGFARR